MEEAEIRRLFSREAESAIEDRPELASQCIGLTTIEEAAIACPDVAACALSPSDFAISMEFCKKEKRNAPARESGRDPAH